MVMGALPNQVKMLAFVGVYSPMSEAEAHLHCGGNLLNRTTNALCSLRKLRSAIS